MARVSVGRQPIFDQSLGVVGFELFYRASEDASTATDSGDRATAVVVVSTYTELGPQRLMGEHPAFLNVTRNFITGGLPLPLPPAGLVLEILPSVGADDEVIVGARRLREQGFRLALDDFAVNDPRTPLLDVVEIVKVDIARTPPPQVKAIVDQVRHTSARLAALRVEGLDDMSRGMELGFDYFQGYHLVRPDVVSAPVITPSHQVCAELLTTLHANAQTNAQTKEMAEHELAEVDAVLHTDVALSYRLLRAINATYGTQAEQVREGMRSLKDAVTALGKDRLQAWLQLLTIAEADRPTDSQSSAALTRGRAMELLATNETVKLPTGLAGVAFLTGLVSSLDQVLGRSTAEIVQQLPLDPVIAAAVVGHSGPLGAMLAAVVATESGVDTELELPGGTLDAFELSRIHLEAVGWSLQVCEPV